MIFTFAFVRLERPSAPGPGSVTAVDRDIAASSSSVLVHNYMELCKKH